MSRPRLSRVCGLLLALWTMLGLVQPASAQKAAIVTAVRSGESAWWQYVKQKIVSTGLYTAVDQIDCGIYRPDADAAAELQAGGDPLQRLRPIERRRCGQCAR
jgi:hypothetical protein